MNFVPFLVVFGFFSSAVLALWIFIGLRNGVMKPIIPLGFPEPRYSREDRPRGFWIATTWNCFWALLFLIGSLLGILGR